MTETYTPPVPQDHQDGRFHWASPTGVQITLPRMGKLPSKLLRETRKLDAEDRMWTLLEAVADQATMDLIDTLPAEDLNVLGEKWGATSTLGESGGSST